MFRKRTFIIGGKAYLAEFSLYVCDIPSAKILKRLFKLADMPSDSRPLIECKGQQWRGSQKLHIGTV